jgi:hypothetical protein
VTEPRCAHHPDRPAAETLGARAYCASCRDARGLATRGLELRARPADCFASYAGGDRWLAFPRGESAHWLAHELGVRAPPGRRGCAAGFAIERADVLAGRRELRGEPPRAADLWVDLDAEGCGIVMRVEPHETRGFSISVRYLQALAAREMHADFYLQLGARGRFFR